MPISLKHSWLLIVGFSLTFVPGRSVALTIDFDGLTGPSDGYSEQGVTFTDLGDRFLETEGLFRGTPNGTTGIGLTNRRANVFPQARADILGGATSVSIDLGDFGTTVDSGDFDHIFLDVFDSNDVLLSSDDFVLDRDFNGLRTLTASDPNIAYAVFGTFEFDGGFIAADNFTWTPVPEPSTALLFSLGISMLAATRRRSR